jgi:uncharacterized repeat protein (TIGR01451 family)
LALTRQHLPTTTSPRRRWWELGRAHAVVAATLSAILIFPVLGVQAAAAADPLVFALIEVSKTATPAAPTALIPGENVTFDIEVSCSSTQTDCVNMKLTDAMPAPLALVAVSASPAYTSQITGNQFVLTFTNPLDVGGIGLRSDPGDSRCSAGRRCEL